MSAPETCACADAARVGKEGNNPDTVAIIVAGGTASALATRVASSSWTSADSPPALAASRL